MTTVIAAQPDTYLLHCEDEEHIPLVHVCPVVAWEVEPPDDDESGPVLKPMILVFNNHVVAIREHLLGDLADYHVFQGPLTLDLVLPEAVELLLRVVSTRHFLAHRAGYDLKMPNGQVSKRPSIATLANPPEGSVWEYTGPVVLADDAIHWPVDDIDAAIEVLDAARRADAGATLTPASLALVVREQERSQWKSAASRQTTTVA